jgi:hypothetical protein
MLVQPKHNCGGKSESFCGGFLSKRGVRTRFGLVAAGIGLALWCESNLRPGFGAPSLPGAPTPEPGVLLPRLRLSVPASGLPVGVTQSTRIGVPPFGQVTAGTNGWRPLSQSSAKPLPFRGMPSNSMVLAGGVYEAAPYSMIVVVPGPHADERGFVRPVEPNWPMPVVKPDLRLIPRSPRQ